ncbi:Asp23/Gls24 family envelope stress response protein [Microbacterium sp. P04]|uniref:Asp23/Gls24 family envelope stress response protein n=1 Tax=Microbacterium sp. P04 TaxID=3366947 RepID=UPI003745B874
MATENKTSPVVGTNAKARVDTLATTGADPLTSTSPVGTDGKAGGRTSIAESVIAKIAGLAARDVPGVYALGGGGARAIGALRDAMNATDHTQGVKVEVGETQAAADIIIVVDYPQPIHEVAEQVREAVAGAITRLAGLQVVEVNVEVTDVRLPDDGADDDDAYAESRVS